MRYQSLRSWWAIAETALSFRRPPNADRTLILPNLIVNQEEGWHMLKENAFRDALYADCPDEIVELAQTLLTPEPNIPGATPLQLTEENYGRVPRVYIECLQDRAISPSLQKQMYTAVSCQKVIR